MGLETTAGKKDLWWGEFPIATAQTVLWEIGAVRFAVQRQALEWRIVCEERPEVNEDEWHITWTDEDPAGFDTVWERYVYGHHGSPLCIVPALADRPVVSRPASPLTLFPGQEVWIYVSTPLWARIKTDCAGVLLKEFSLLPLRDTWFGPSTWEGEMCYAARTHARQVLDAMPRQPHRATSMLLLRNKAQSALLLERLNLPTPHLGLYHNGAGELWTEAIELVREEDGEMAKLRIRPGAPAGISGLKRVAEPRSEIRGGVLVRAFGSLFG